MSPAGVMPFRLEARRLVVEVVVIVNDAAPILSSHGDAFIPYKITFRYQADDGSAGPLIMPVTVAGPAVAATSRTAGERDYARWLTYERVGHMPPWVTALAERARLYRS